MSDLSFPKSILENIKSKRDMIHPFESLDPARTALVVVDLQNVFLREGAPSEVPAAREIVPNVNKLATHVRQKRGMVAWVQLVYDPEVPWPVLFDTLLGLEKSKAIQDGLMDSSNDFRLWPGLDVQDDDLIVRKTRFSAFLPGYCDLHQLLKQKRIDTILIAGVSTNTCCETTARDAMMLDYKVIMVSDANAAANQEIHLRTLHNFLQVFGDVRTTTDVISLLGA